MSVSSLLKSAVEEKNIEDIRGGLWSCIAVDMNMTGKFKESLEFVLSNGISEEELFEPDDNVEFKTEPTTENYSELGGLLRVNFSKNKLDALHTMGIILYPPKTQIKEHVETRRSHFRREEKQSSQRRSASSAKKCDPFITGGAIIGVGCGAIVAAKIGARLGGIIGGGIVGATVGTIIGIALANKVDKE